LLCYVEDYVVFVFAFFVVGVFGGLCFEGSFLFVCCFWCLFRLSFGFGCCLWFVGYVVRVVGGVAVAKIGEFITCFWKLWGSFCKW
jgi:hypothetical protein